MPTEPSVLDFALALKYDELDPETQAFARRCLLDTLGVAAAGSTTKLSRLIAGHAVAHFGAGQDGASILFDGRTVSPSGAALANATTIDSMDAHDGHKLTKGHVGCGVVAATLALAEANQIVDDAELLAMLVIGYELGTRAGIALHRTVDDYHTSGAWVAVACAALTARALRLDRAAAWHAVGIAEYHGPRSQMMRVIDHPTMLKDGSGWGALAGVSAGYLAADGFTGAPAVTVEADEVADLWADLGQRWRIFEQYFKLHPVCRWAQPAVEAALSLCSAHGIESGRIDHLEVTTFHEACRLATPEPRTTEEAQYSLPFPVAAAVVNNALTVDEVSGAALANPEVLRLAGSMKLVEDRRFNELFPAQRFAQVTVVLEDGTRHVSEPTEARGDPEFALTQAEIEQKFDSLAGPVLGAERAEEIKERVNSLGTGSNDGVVELVALLREPTNGT